MIYQNTYKDGKRITNRSAYDLAAEWRIHNISSAILPSKRGQSDHVDLDTRFKHNQTYTEIATIIAICFGLL